MHLAAEGFPMLGDARYGGPAFVTRPDGARLDCTRPLLHALSVELAHPNGGRLAVTAPAPADLRGATQFLRSERPA